MKFFDLEMDESLKAGGRSISFSHHTWSGTCVQRKYTNGYSFFTCASNKYKDNNDDNCKTHYEKIEK